MTASSTNAKDAIRKALEDNAPNWLHVPGIVAETGLSETTVRGAVKEMVKDALLESKKDSRTTLYTVTVTVEAPVDAKVDVAPAPPVAPPVPEPSANAGKTVSGKDKKKPGPRTGVRREAVQARDDIVLKHLTAHPEGRNRRVLAEETELDPGLLYISLWRLEHEGQITKVRDGSRAPVWRIKTDGGGKASSKASSKSSSASAPSA